MTHSIQFVSSHQKLGGKVKEKYHINIIELSIRLDGTAIIFYGWQLIWTDMAVIGFQSKWWKREKEEQGYEIYLAELLDWEKIKNFLFKGLR